MVYDLGIIKRQRYVEPTFIATGGTVTTSTSNSINYVYHTFTTSSVFIPVYNITAECLIVGGGGAGSDIAGGGAGGYRSLTINFQKNNAFSITVGAGGTTATTTGYNSSIIGNGVNYIASGGGNAGQTGGSGGGGTGSAGSGAAGNTPSTSPSQGNTGGDTSGGGAGGAGSGDVGGSGTIWLNGNSYAGGGSGGGGASSGGGANSAGTPNTGGGGSIGNYLGGDGIVIIRYTKYLASTPPAFDTSFAYNSLLLSNQSTSLDFSTGTVNMLLIGGGGGGGGGYGSGGNVYYGGGGGAGALYINSFSPRVTTTLVVTIGAGGTGVNSDTRFGTTGTSSTVKGKQPLGGDTLQTITATGGGAGQSYATSAYTSNSPLANGGSGGGSAGGTAGSSTLSQNDGPNYYGHAGYLGGGGLSVAQGGGASGSAIPGQGLYINIGNSSTFSTTFAIGGGGAYSGGSGGAGAVGGGGGAGGAGISSVGYSGGAGIAFFWHLTSLPVATVGSTNAYTISFQNGYTIYAFINGSGTITFGPQWGNNYLKDLSPIANSVQGYGNMLSQGSFNPYSTNWSTYFNGTTDYLSIQHSDAFNITSDFTVEGWFYATSSTNSSIITKSITSELSPFNIRLSAQNIITTSYNTSFPPTVEYLVVAGGGGGGYSVGGGGGGGGLLTGTFVAFQPGINYVVTVGPGGAGGGSASVAGFNGSTSSIAGGEILIQSDGGGGGGAAGVTGIATGLSGGSGGGGSMVTGGGTVNGGSGTSGPPRQGYDGGTGVLLSGQYAYSGGGGGAGAPGTNGGPGHGGIGLASSITGTATYYAGGGGGGGSGNGVGGSGGGGNRGANGSTNTGGGGGGSNASAAGGIGGSGIVVIRYPDLFPAATATTGSPNVSTTGGYRIYVFTSSGSATFAPTENLLVSTQINLNTWNYVSISKSGSTYTSMLNGGNQVTTSTNVTIYNNTQTIYIGYDGANYFQGYISNLRFLNGSSVIAVPRLPFSLISNTALLVCANGTMIDKSSHNFTVSQNGTPAVRRFSPFINSGPYNSLIHGGSIYFDGSTDFITVPANTVNVQGNSFNIEFWSYPEPIISTAYFIDSRYNTSNSMAFGTSTTGTNDGISLALLTSGLCTVSIGTATTFTSINLETLRVKFRAWNHIALVKNNTVVTLYINSEYAGSTTTTVTVNTIVRSLYTAVSPNLPLVTNNFSIGRSSYLSGGYYKGYISNLHILKGTISERVTTTLGPVGNAIEYLIVAGGGGGGGTNNEFGGGGGGFRYGSFVTTQSGATYTITVGSGGSLNGDSSSIVGGGVYLESAGGGNYTVSAGAGGSGSGGFGAGNTPSTSPAQGQNGGLVGGGGAGAIGSGMNGGTGSTSTITGSSLMYSGGGGGNNTTGVLTGGNGGAGGGGYGWASLNFEYLVVAGGGCGGTGSTGGGGGGGGFLSSNFISTITSATYIVTVGTGGTGGGAGGTGGNSSIVGGGVTILAYGGGNGGNSGATGNSGGSGGGRSGGVVGAGQGNVAGASGGGGGAGAAGGYHGGDGLQSNIDGGNYYYSGGGGSGSNGGTGANGGLGGGGKGTGFTFGNPGTGGRNVGIFYGGINTGGGGGAPGNNNGNGGSGIIIIRYAGTQVCTGGSVSTVGTYTVHTFLTSGSLVENITSDTTRAGTTGIRGAGANGGTNTGGGGGGAGSGGSGIVAIRYLGQPRGFGGNITTNVYGSYTVHTFLSSDTYVDSKIIYSIPVAPVLSTRTQSPGFTVNYIVVAGGGAGGNTNGVTGGGGGGGGGVSTGSFIATEIAGSILITVGAGGATAGQNGSDSQIAGQHVPPHILAKGGGGGGLGAGSAGGSGGGGGNDGGAGGAATQNTLGINATGTGYGNAGAGGSYAYGLGTVTGGGGGGAGGAGSGASPAAGNGVGGPGLTVDVLGVLSVPYGAGGALSGSGAGTATLGNGGGGGNASTLGAAGGSGRVVLWHADTLSSPVIITSSTFITTYTALGYKLYVFFVSGTLEFKYSNSSLLLNFNNGAIFDATTQNNIYPIGDVSISNSIVRYNNASIYFDGNGDGLGIGSTSTTTATNMTAVGSGNFTVEMWMYPLSLYNTGTAPALLDARTTSTSVIGSSYLGYTGITDPAGSQIGWKDNTIFVTTGTVIINTWNHIAVVRSGSTLSMYINGSVTSSTTNTTNYTIPFKYIGISYNSLSFKGYIDDLRITQSARYTSNPFTPPLTRPQLK